VQLARIVLDANVLVSAVRSALGPSFALIQVIRAGGITMCCNPALFLEYEDVLKRPLQRAASGLTVGDINEILMDLASHIEPVNAHYRWRPQLRDPSDEMVLEAAVNANVDAIVTYNLRDFKPAANFGIRVLSPAQSFTQFKLPKSNLRGATP
jgi:putative PIN family toxin of toxin-antitoxin system